MSNNPSAANARLPRPLVVSGSIIEISDSEDDYEHIRWPSPSQKAPLKQVASGALDNGATPAARDKAVPPERKGENAPPHAVATLSQTPSIQVLMEPPKPDLVIPQDQLRQVLEVVPDVQPEYAQELLTESKTVEATLNALFENPAYPKVDRKGKRKAEDPMGKERGQPKPKIDYTTTERPTLGGPYYYELALEQLQVDFPLIPKPYIRSVLLLKKELYVPAHLQLLADSKLPILPYKRKVIAYRSKGKAPLVEDPEFTTEREWLVHKLQEGALVPIATGAFQQSVTPSDEDGIECGCCFTSYPFEKMVQCPDAHLFCSECMVSYAENLLGSHNPNIVCMDQSGCKLAFPDSELRRFLDDKLLELYERVKQHKEIEMAGLEGLEECPFCEYKVVIENPEEKLFRCEREECGAVSCRACKKLDHLPKSCKEMEAEKLLDGRHAIEEAMTQALLRNCPKCEKAFIKEAGCNKMTCPNCRTLSCYVCRKVITSYEHFNQNPNAPQASANSNKCLLWDQVEQRHADEVKAAAERATEAYRRENPDVAQEDIKVDLPVAPKAPAPLPGMPALVVPRLDPPIPVRAPLDVGALAAEIFNEHRMGAAQRDQMIRQWVGQQHVPAPMPQPILGLPAVAVPPQRIHVLPHIPRAPPVQQAAIPRARRRRR